MIPNLIFWNYLSHSLFKCCIYWKEIEKYGEHLPEELYCGKMQALAFESVRFDTAALLASQLFRGNVGPRLHMIFQDFVYRTRHVTLEKCQTAVKNAFEDSHFLAPSSAPNGDKK
ncbi:MAG: hypothetical protein Q4C70_05040 [Planctomycetia bacterium]|nr:hypothetical protein [Planctomycetia bacterium]